MLSSNQGLETGEENEEDGKIGVYRRRNSHLVSRSKDKRQNNTDFYIKKIQGGVKL